jgi:restriction endonuclease S subunit
VVNRGTLGEDWIAQSHFGKVSESKFKTKKLSEICDSIGTGKTAPRTQYTESGKVIVKVGNLSGRGISYENIERQFVTKEWANKYPDIELEEGDILFTAAAHGPKWIGLKVDIFNGLPVRLGKSAIYCAELMRCRVSADSGIDPYYVLLFLRSSKGYEELQKCIRGQSGHIYPNEVAQIDVPLPDNFDEKEIEKAIKDIKRCLSLKKQSEQLDTEVTDYCDNVFEARSKKPIIAR